MKRITRWLLPLLGIFLIFGIVSCSSKNDSCHSKIVLRTKRGYWGIKKTYVVCADGTGEVNYKLPRGLGDHPDWSPDGNWIVFDTLYSAAVNESQLFLYHIPTKERITVDDKLYRIRRPSWSPSGTEVAFQGSAGIYVLDVQCVYSEGECNFLPEFIIEGIYPSWSYDGQNLAFMVYGNELVSFKLQIINLDNSINIIDITPENASGCLEPDWSPTENKIVSRCAIGGDSHIILFDLDTGANINLTEGSLARNGDPRWSQDGNKIAFITHRDEDLEDCMNIECNISADELYVMDNDGTNTIRVTFHSEESILWFAWIP